jgi:hypothetical protein
MPKLLSTQEVANILGLHKAVIKRYIRKGILPVIMQLLSFLNEKFKIPFFIDAPRFLTRKRGVSHFSLKFVS